LNCDLAPGKKPALEEPSLTRTEVARGAKAATRASLRTLSNARDFVHMVSDPDSPALVVKVKEFRNAFQDLKRRRVIAKAINSITKENVGYCKKLLSLGLVSELRHLDKVRGTFLVTEGEYLAAPTLKDATAASGVIYSNDPEIISQSQYVFDILWENAESADDRIGEIERGIEPSRLIIIHGAKKIRELFVKLLRAAEREILLLLPTAGTARREQKIGTTALLSDAAVRGVEVRLLSPDSNVLHARSKMKVESAQAFSVKERRIPEAIGSLRVTVLVVDEGRSLVMERKDDSGLDSSGGVDVAIYSNRNASVGASKRLFERIWEDVDLLEAERRTRKTAELMQDILTHDIRNYNQITITNAEILRDELSNNSHAIGLVNSILEATDGSSRLVDRAKKLGSIISSPGAQLSPIALEPSIRNAISLVSKANPGKLIDTSFEVETGARVLADDMLDEVFTNILSNSINYTETYRAAVKILVKGVVLDRKRYWKVEFEDRGRGIPDSVKESLFTRYLQTAHGTGLGLSIVYALAVARYSGRVAVTDRVKGDSSQGTKLTVWLPMES
jgi:signal transduction histidine kinase